MLSHVFAVAISRPLLEACVETLDHGAHSIAIKLCALDPKPLWGAVFILLVAFAWAPLSSPAQDASQAVATANGLPDAPVANTLAASPGDEAAVNNPVSENGSATISGTVLDTNGSEVEGARVELDGRTASGARVLQTGANGEFTFAGLSPGTYRITITGPGMGTVVTPETKLNAGDFRILSPVVLAVAAATTEIRVSGNRDELAEEQVQIAVQQRVMGVFPNFYSSYDWNAPPMGAKQKFQLALRAVTDPMAFLGAAGVAGAEQFYNVFPAYGGGIKGYSKRYGAAYANDASGRMFSSAVFPSLFHQDPRYFYRGSGPIRSRALYAISAAVIARGDNGRWQPNYSEIFGNFAAGALSNVYYPAANRGVTLTVTNALIETAGRAGTNLVREFLLRGLTSKVPSYAAGKP